MTLHPRLRAVADLLMPEARESVGRHEYDGVVQDLSPDGVAAALTRLGDGPPLDDSHDEAHLSAAEQALRVTFGELAEHRRNPLVHIGNLDLAGYDREYAPAAERADARRRHLQGWPDAVDAALESLDRVPAPVAQALRPAVGGLAAAVRPEDEEIGVRALAAQARLVEHVERAAVDGPTETALGGAKLARLLGAMEATQVDLGALAARADAERDRLRGLLDDACRALRPGMSTAAAVADLVRDHPDADGVLAEARALTEEALTFTAEHQLAPYTDGICRVEPAPQSRRWAMAMMSWSGPEEQDAPSFYHVTPPEPSWPPAAQEQWLAVFSRTTLPAITVHEVSPGHYAHGRALRHARTPARRLLQSVSFIEGWAHYVEEVCLEEGYRSHDAHFQAGVAIEALVRVTRLACAIGVHTGAMTVEQAAARFTADAHLQGPAARSEAERATFDPTYGRYTWGKLAIMDLRELARSRWGSEFSLPRLHAALLDLGAPPLGLLEDALG